MRMRCEFANLDFILFRNSISKSTGLVGFARGNRNLVLAKIVGYCTFLQVASL